MLTLFAATHEAPETDFAYRIDDIPAPRIGDFVWMNPDDPKDEWQVISTHLFQSPTQTICVAGLALADESCKVPMPMHEAIHIYLMDGKPYTYCLAGGKHLAPELGDFIEYEPVTCRPLPIDKQVGSYERLVGNADYEVYAVSLKRVELAIAA
jgi:hypothetical protein